MAEAVQHLDAPAPQWKLLVSDTSGIQETYFVTGEVVTIGRELDNDIALDDLNVSRYHARLTLQDKNLVVEDLDSSNGTVVNGVVIAGSHPLQANDTINVGGFALKVRGSSARSRSKTDNYRTGAALSPSASQQDKGPRRYLLLAAATMMLVVALLLCVVFFRWIYSGNLPFLSSGTEAALPATVASNAPAIVINQSPAQNDQVQTNQSISVQATASDPSGISRMELWVNDKQVHRVESPLEQSAASMTAVFQWAADSVGVYTIDIRAYNEAGQVAIARVATLSAVGNTPTPIPPTVTPLPTITPLPSPPTPTVTPRPTATPVEATATPVSPTPSPTPQLALLSVKAPRLNVRAGPGTEYEQVGQMQRDDKTAIVGQANGWWKINLETAPDGQGWVFGNPNLVTVENGGDVPVAMVPLPPTGTATATPTGTPTRVPTFTPTPTRPPATIIRPPDGKTLLIVRNNSISNKPARLTLSGGKSVGGGKELDPPPNGQIEMVLEPDFYRALWSASWNGFTRGVDFDAVAGKVMIMSIVPEDGVTNTQILDELVIEVAPTPTPVLPPPTPLPGEPVAAPGKGLFVVSNRSVQNEYARLTITGGNYGGGTEFTLDANTQTQLEMLPGDYRTIWNSPAGRGVNAGREFTVSAGEVIQGWIIPENGQVFMQFPGQEAIQINN